jgi:2-methylisocitrate lyase-like PEP mutase family enzyme
MRSDRVFSDLPEDGITPFIGVYDAFSASLASRRFDQLFLSGFGFAASHYGLPDVGFVTWSDMLTYVARIRAAVPAPRLLVDIDDGYVDTDVAVHTARQLERLGAWGVVLEDQQRPRRCGHFDGKRILPVGEYVEKLERVLEARRDLVVVARTDSADPADALDRVEAYAEAGADAVLIDGVRDLSVLREARERAGVPVVFNQIAGGKSPQCSLEDLRASGVSIAIYSTPCLFAAQRAMEEALDEIASGDGALEGPADGAVGVRDCTAVLNDNLPAEAETA